MEKRSKERLSIVNYKKGCIAKSQFIIRYRTVMLGANGELTSRYQSMSRSISGLIIIQIKRLWLHSLNIDIQRPYEEAFGKFGDHI